MLRRAAKINNICDATITCQYANTSAGKGEIDQMQLYFIDFNEIKSKLTKNMSKIKICLIVWK